jgi:DNA-binding transcriptional regulator YiaG
MTTRYMLIMHGLKTEITPEEYERFFRKAKTKSALPIGWYDLGSGVLINQAEISAIVPIKDHASDVKTEITAEPMELTRPAPEPVAEPEVAAQEEDLFGDNELGEPPDKITQERLRAILDKSGLSQENFASKLQVGVSTLRLALREGRISVALSDKIKATFGE